MGVVIWPITLLLALNLLRAPLTELLPYLKRIKVLGAELEFEKALSAGENIADSANLPASSIEYQTHQESRSPETTNEPGRVVDSSSDGGIGTSAKATSGWADGLIEVAKVHPIGAILVAMRHLHEALLAQADVHRGTKVTPQGIARTLVQRGKISQETYALIHKLQGARNAAVHEAPEATNSDDAIRFIKLADRAIAAVRQQL